MREIHNVQAVAAAAQKTYEYFNDFLRGASRIPYDDRMDTNGVKDRAQQAMLQLSRRLKGARAWQQNFVWFPDLMIEGMSPLVPYPIGTTNEEIVGGWNGIKFVLTDYNLTRVVTGNHTRVHDPETDSVIEDAYTLTIFDREETWSKSYEIKIRANQTFTIKKVITPWLTMDEGDMVDAILPPD